MLHVSIKPEVLWTLGPLQITNSLLTSWVTLLLLVGAALLVGANYKRLPSGLQHVFEMAYESFQNMAEEAMGKYGHRFVPFVVTAFLFITLSNWVGVLPGVGSLVRVDDAAAATSNGIILLGTPKTDGHAVDTSHAKEVKPAATPAAVTKDSHGAPAATDSHGAPAKGDDAHEEHSIGYTPLFRGGNADLNSTLALAIIAQLMIHISGIRSAGIKHHLHHFKNPIEIVTEISKVLSFGFRLFGNVFAGEVLLTVMGSLLVVLTGRLVTGFGFVGGLVSVPFLALEFFVGAIQGLVFAMLVIGFLGLFVKTDHAEAHH